MAINAIPGLDEGQMQTLRSTVVDALKQSGQTLPDDQIDDYINKIAPKVLGTADTSDDEDAAGGLVEQAANQRLEEGKRGMNLRKGLSQAAILAGGGYLKNEDADRIMKPYEEEEADLVADTTGKVDAFKKNRTAADALDWARKQRQRTEGGWKREDVLNAEEDATRASAAEVAKQAKDPASSVSQAARDNAKARFAAAGIKPPAIDALSAEQANNVVRQYFGDKSVYDLTSEAAKAKADADKARQEAGFKQQELGLRGREVGLKEQELKAKTTVNADPEQQALIDQINEVFDMPRQEQKSYEARLVAFLARKMVPAGRQPSASTLKNAEERARRAINSGNPAVLAGELGAGQVDDGEEPSTPVVSAPRGGMGGKRVFNPSTGKFE